MVMVGSPLIVESSFRGFCIHEGQIGMEIVSKWEQPSLLSGKATCHNALSL